MRKSTFIVTALTTVSILIMQSCNNYVSDIIVESTPKGLAMEVKCHYISTDKTVFINFDEHHDFLSTELIAKIQQDQFLRARANYPGTESDTIFSFHEIPLVTEFKSETNLYYSGHSETSITDLTSIAHNPIYELTENPIDVSARIRKTIVKDGFLTGFNSMGEEVMRTPYETPDLSEFLDTLTVYLTMLHHHHVTPPAAFKVGSHNVKPCPPEYHIKQSKLPGGNVILESKVLRTPISKAFKSATSALIQLRSVIELDPEMTKTLRYELHEGDQLLERKVYTYASEVKFQSLYRGRVVTENPRTVVSEVLTFDIEGKPMLRQTSQHFLQNQIIYHCNHE